MVMNGLHPPTLHSLIEQQQLPAAYLEQVNDWLLPLSQWLAQRRRHHKTALLVGLNGAQGTGKSTVALFLQALLEQQGLVCCTLSLDDFYLGRKARTALAQDIHPLLATRGVPGTHDLQQLNTVLDALLAGDSILLPRFNKADDDVVAQEDWPMHSGAVDVIVLEGWCVGCPAQRDAVLLDPVNALEADEDAEGRWRGYVNKQLRGDYADLFARLNVLLMLQAPSMQAVLQWRRLQEQKLTIKASGQALMDASAIRRFVQHFERLTRHCLVVLPLRADYILTLDSEHCFTGAQLREHG